METFVSELVTRLATTSVQTALLVALVWALCRALPRLPASTQCWLWWVVALQAVVGLIAAPLELPWLPAQISAAPTAATLMPLAEAATPLSLATSSSPAWHLPTWQGAVLVLWLAGMGVTAVRTALAWRASRALVRTSQPCRDGVLVGALRMAAEAHGLPAAPPLRLSRQITSPQLVGVLRPVLLLPMAGSIIADDDLDMALTHELVHLRRRDLWWGLLPALAQHLAFFHPLVHYAVREYGVAREAAVDAAVVAGSRHCRGDYGRLLVRLGVAPRPGAGLASASPSFLSLKRRLLMLQNTSSFPRLGAALILAAVGVVGVTPLRLVAQTAPAQASPAAEATPAPAASPAPAAAPKPAMAVAPAAPAVVPAPPAESAVPPPPAKHVPPAPPAPPAHPAPPAAPAPPAPRALPKALAEAERLSNNKQKFFWIQRDDKTYLIRDPATLKQLDALHAPQRALGERQSALGRQQAELGRQMGQASAQISAQAAAQRALADAEKAEADGTKHYEKMFFFTDVQRDQLRDAATVAEQAAKAQVDSAVIQRQVDQSLGDARRNGQGEKIEAMAQQQAALATKQAEMARQQAGASRRARKEADAVIDRAIKEGLAQRIDG